MLGKSSLASIALAAGLAVTAVTPPPPGIVRSRGALGTSSIASTALAVGVRDVAVVVTPPTPIPQPATPHGGGYSRRQIARVTHNNVEVITRPVNDDDEVLAVFICFLNTYRN